MTKFWLRQNWVHWFIGSVQLVVLSVGLLESSAVRGSIRLPRCSLRGRPGVLYDGFLASLVSSSLYLWLVVGWMDVQCSIQVYFNRIRVGCGVAEVYSMSCLLIQFEAVGDILEAVGSPA